MNRVLQTVALLASVLYSQASVASEAVTIDNFARAETDRYFQAYVNNGGFGQFIHRRNPTPIDDQSVIRMNRDTLYSVAVFDLEQPVVIQKPDTGSRFQSMQVISQDHYSKRVIYDAGEYTITREMVGTRYVAILFRTLVNAKSAEDITVVNAIQDRIGVSQSSVGSFGVPDWDSESLGRIRDALNVLGSSVSVNDGMFGDAGSVERLLHLIGTAYGWGGNPRQDVMYLNVTPAGSSANEPHALTVGDVPVDGFWSISLYNQAGYFEENEFAAYSLNNLTAERDADGRVTVHFGGDPSQSNYLPIADGWNYVVRLYQPHANVLSGEWIFPEARPVH